MITPYPNEQELLKTILEPLLGDFEHWFDRSRQLLETETLHFLSESEQTKLLDRVCEAQNQVRSTKALFQATGKQVGVDMQVLMPWHHLVTECWHVSQKHRQEKQKSTP